jgi:hypothetical protein
LSLNQALVFEFQGYSGAFSAAGTQLAPQVGLKNALATYIGDVRQSFML